jgi:hypothetical protein
MLHRISRVAALATLLTLLTASTATAASSYSGQATLLQASVAVVNVTLGDTGPLPASGGSLTSSVAAVDLPGLGSVGAGRASTSGQGDESLSSAALADLDLNLLGIPITADAVGSRAEARCQGSVPEVRGDARVVELVINGTPIVASVPNLTIDVAGLITVVVNEQTSSAGGNAGTMTVNALHVSGPAIEIVVASAHSGITCS